MKRKIAVLFLAAAAVLLAFLSIDPVSPSLAESEAVVTTREEFISALNSAEEGEVIYVTDIDFNLSGTGAVNDASVLNLNKSVTIKPPKTHKNATFYGASFILDGTKLAERSTKFTFEDIIFDGGVKQSEIKKEDWSLTYLEGTDEPISPNPLKCKFAVAFSGNTDAEFKGCQFNGYMFDQGGAVRAFYGNYDFNGYNNSTCSLTALFENCSFVGNSAKYGGAVSIDALDKNVELNLENCTFKNNVTGVTSDNWGGGAMHVLGGRVNAHGCDFIENTANFKYIGDEIQTDSRQGGALFLYDGELNATDCRFIGNSASCGGAIGMTGTSYLNTDGCVFTENEAISVDGSFESSYGRMSGKSIGGAIFAQNYCTLDLLNTSIYGNVAQNVSGGLHIVYSESNVSFAEIKATFCSIAGNICNTELSEYKSEELWRPYVYPYDVYSVKGFSAFGCFIADYLYGEEEFLISQAPARDNDYNCLVSTKEATERGWLAELTERNDHLYFAGGEEEVVPSAQVKERLGDKYDLYFGGFSVGNNYPRISPSIEITDGRFDGEFTYDYGRGIELPSAQKDGFVFDGYTFDGESFSSGRRVLFGLMDNKLVLTPRFSEAPPEDSSSSFVGEAEPDRRYAVVIVASACVLLAVLAAAIVAAVIKKREKTPENARESTILEQRPEVDISSLTDRERQVLELLLDGKKRSEIAAVLFVSEETVKKHITAIYSKLGVTSRSELFAKFR